MLSFLNEELIHNLIPLSDYLGFFLLLQFK